MVGFGGRGLRKRYSQQEDFLGNHAKSIYRCRTLKNDYFSFLPFKILCPWIKPRRHTIR